MKPCILLIEDDGDMRELVAGHLEHSGFDVQRAEDGIKGQALALQYTPDLVLLDLMLPKVDGLTLCQRLRRDERTARIPILMLTALGSTKDKVSGFNSGADDYLAKPFEPKELALRIASILRRATPPPASAAPPPTHARFGGFAFDIDRGELRKGEEITRLTERERFMLQLLARAQGEPVSRQALAGGGGVNERTVDVQMNRLRRKIEHDPANPAWLQTARGTGYRLVVDR